MEGLRDEGWEGMKEKEVLLQPLFIFTHLFSLHFHIPFNVYSSHDYNDHYDINDNNNNDDDNNVYSHFSSYFSSYYYSYFNSYINILKVYLLITDMAKKILSSLRKILLSY